MKMLNYRLEYLNAENDLEVIKVSAHNMCETENLFVFQNEKDEALFMLPTSRLICIKRLDD